MGIWFCKFGKMLVTEAKRTDLRYEKQDTGFRFTFFYGTERLCQDYDK